MLGAKGQLGSFLCPQLRLYDHDVYEHSNTCSAPLSFDLTSTIEWSNFFSSYSVDCIINLRALTDVDACEVCPSTAFAINCSPHIALARSLSCLDTIPHIIYISTDQVYSGIGPHIEESPHPCNVYGSTKLMAELFIQQYPCTVLRTNYIGKSFVPSKMSLSDWIVNSLQTSQRISLFTDVFFSPLHISALAQSILKVVKSKTTGTYNLSATGSISKADFAIQLASYLQLPIDNASFSLSTSHSFKAKRPTDMSLCSDLFSQTFDLELPDISSQVVLCSLDYL